MVVTIVVVSGFNWRWLSRSVENFFGGTREELEPGPSSSILRWENARRKRHGQKIKSGKKEEGKKLVKRRRA